MIDGKNLFDKRIKTNLRTYNSIGKLQLIKDLSTQLVAH